MNDYIKLGVLLCLLLLAMLIGVWQGSIHLGISELLTISNQPIIQLRIARVVLSALVGAGLGCCGVVLQALLRNPLAEPYLLGTSSGAGLGAVIAILIGIPISLFPFAGFAGALLSMIAVYALSHDNGRISMYSLMLSGILIAMTCSGLVVFLVSLGNRDGLHNMMWWLLGNLQTYDFTLLGGIAFMVIVGTGILFIFSRDLDAISLGEEPATHMGISVERLKKVIFIITSLITGALVSIAGMIGFVGLVIPHLMRHIVGPRHRILIPATCLGSATFLILCDMLCRSLFPPIEIPIGVMTSLIGAPVFLMILKWSK